MGSAPCLHLMCPGTSPRAPRPTFAFPPGSSALPDLKLQEGSPANIEIFTKVSSSTVNFRGHFSCHKGCVMIAAQLDCQFGVLAG